MNDADLIAGVLNDLRPQLPEETALELTSLATSDEEAFLLRVRALAPSITLTAASDLFVRTRLHEIRASVSRVKGDNWSPHEPTFHGPLTQRQADGVIERLRRRFQGGDEPDDVTGSAPADR